MMEETQDGKRVRPPFLMHFILITLVGGTATAAMDRVFDQPIPVQADDRIAGFLGAGAGHALLALLVYYVTWKGGVGRHPIGAGWGAATFTLFLVLIGHLGQANLLG